MADKVILTSWLLEQYIKAITGYIESRGNRFQDGRLMREVGDTYLPILVDWEVCLLKVSDDNNCGWEFCLIYSFNCCYYYSSFTPYIVFPTTQQSMLQQSYYITYNIIYTYVRMYR